MNPLSVEQGSGWKRVGVLLPLNESDSFPLHVYGKIIGGIYPVVVEEIAFFYGTGKDIPEAEAIGNQVVVYFLCFGVVLQEALVASDAKGILIAV